MTFQMRRVILLLPLLVLAIIIAIAVSILDATSRGGRDSSAIGFSMTGQKSPALVMPALGLGNGGGESIALADMAGRAHAVNVFASWCAPCKIEAPAIAAIAERMPVIGINYRDKPEDARAFLESFGNPYHAIGVDPDGGASIRLGVHGLPETFIIAADGTIIYHHKGPIFADAMRTGGVIAAAMEKALR